MTEQMRFTTSDGKYTVIQEERGGMRFLRHGEPCPAADRDFKFVGLILALAYEASSLLSLAEDLSKEYDPDGLETTKAAEVAREVVRQFGKGPRNYNGV